MGVTALRHAGTRLQALRETVPLYDGHPVGVGGQDVRREQPREAPAHDDGMPPAPPAAFSPTAVLSGRVHRSAPLVAMS
ncbi:hypothetical protein ACH3VS_35580 [Streptomyces sp. WSLK1-3]|uniref:hypothetical protein n=1 Tax=Streptomyces sp. WSLK1-3 TaxID=3375475 RepID=UPI0037ADECD6